MNDQELDRLFERFRRRGDVLALGAIFDATAPELLRVAMSLVREPGEADDLLQETFLTAIERSERYEAGRRLVPWLLGILVLHARERRAQRRRELDPARLAPRETSAPEAHALGRELEQELERALAELSARERGVLESYLRHGKGAAEIASETGAARGAVRMQIHRGLDRLRRLLPAGLALGAAGSANAQGMSAVRARVLRAGETATKNFAPGASSAPGAGLAGALMGKELVLAGVLAAVAGAWFLVERVARRPGSERGDVARAESPALPRERPTLDRTPLEEPRSTAMAAVPSAAASRAPLAAAADPDLAALHGRVVEHDGQPVAGVPVALIEVQETQIYPTLFAAVDAPSFPRLVAASAVTGADGTFELRGATARALHGLGVDLGGERATLRMLDALLSPGLTTELGDVVLDATGALAGRVVDERGQPVAGARVRVGALPELALQLGLQYLAAGGALTELPRKGDPSFVFELPDWASGLEPRLPFATTTTDAEGRFALGHVASGRLTVLVDAAGFARAAPSFELGAREEHDLGELVLESGASLRGRVLDSAGRPVGGAELRGGMLGARDSLAVFGPLVQGDGEGRFVIEHVPGASGLAVIGRRDALSPWICAREEGGEFAVRLGIEQEFVAEVVDTAGTPVNAPQFFLAVGREQLELGVLASPLRPLAARPLVDEPGRFRLGPLARGTYLVVARAPGLAESSAGLELGSEPPLPLRFRLAALARTEVVVRDSETGGGIAGALVRVQRPVQPVGSAHTDSEGRAWLDFPLDPVGDTWLAVEHPRYAPCHRALTPSSAPPAGPIEVVLSSGAHLVARLADPVLAARRCMLQLWYEGGTSRHGFHLPRFCAVPREGALDLEHLEPWQWSWSLFESVAGGDVLGFLTPERIPQSLASGKLELREGETVELLLSGKLAPGSAGPGASLSGVVRVEGRLAGELEVNLEPLDGRGEAETLYTEGHGGRFRFDGVPAGRYLLSVSAPELGLDPDEVRELVQEKIDVGDAETRELEFDVASIPARLSVSTAEGAPASDVELLLVLMDENTIVNVQATTDEDGNARVVMTRAGRYAVLATQHEEGAARGELEVVRGGANELALRLSRGVECAGRLHVEPGAKFDAGAGELLVTPEDDSWFNARVPVELVEGAAPFRLVGLSPGKYKVLLWGGDDMLHTTFELPERGDGNLELSFTAGRGRR